MSHYISTTHSKFPVSEARRKHSEQALLESEQRLQLFIEHAPAAIAMFDREMRYLVASRRWKDDYGIVADVTGRSHYDVFPEMPARWKEIHRRGLAGEVLRSDADAFERHDGKTQYVKWEVRPWFSIDGTIGGILIAAEEVTARVIAEEGLREQRRLLKSVTDNASVALFIMDERQQCRFMNPAAERLTGYTLAETRGRPLHDVIHHSRPDGRPYPLADCPIDQAFPKENRMQGEEVFVHKQGHFYPVAFTASPIKNEAGRSIGTVLEVDDVSKRKSAEAALGESEERFRTLADNIAQLAWMADGEGWIYWYNQRWFDYTGTSLDEMQGWGWQKVHHPDHINRVIAKWKQAHATGEPWEDTFPLRDTGGNYRWFLSRALPIKDPKGAIIRWFGTNTDVTDLRETQETLARSVEQLKKSEQRLRLAQQAARIGSFEWDIQTGVNTWTPELEAMYGLPAGSFAQTQPAWETFLYPADREKTIEGVNDALATLSPVEREFRIVRRDGLIRWLMGRWQVFRETSANSLRLTGVNIDITDRKKAEEELRDLTRTLEDRIKVRTRQLEDSNAALEAFGYSVAHDLRAPLRTMQGFAKALMEDYGEAFDDVAGDYAMRIVRGAERMDLLIQDLLTYSRLSRGEISLEPVSLDQVLSEAAKQVEFSLHRSGGRLVIAADLPCVVAHRATLVQVFANLLSNGLKFVWPGATPSMSVWAEQNGDVVRVFVEDNGIGIAPEHRERIFQVFERLHGNESYPGTGIGLAIVKKGTERLGGRVGIESSPSGGSRFWVEFPKCDT